MYLYETHLHTAPVSACARASVRESLEFYKQKGYAGVFITNHFLDGNVNISHKLPWEERLKFYFTDYEAGVELGKEIGISVFFGIETSYNGADFLVYGLDPQWYLDHPEIHGMKKSEQLPYLMEHGALVIQAHPYRKGSPLMDTQWMDGIELNCHPLYKNIFLPEILTAAKQNNLPLTCGGDYHADTYRPKCGMYLPDDLRDTRDLADYIRTSRQTRLCVQDVDQEPFDMEYRIH